MEQWLSPARAAQYVGVSKRTLQRWEHVGRLRPSRTPSGHRRYRLSELNTLLHP